jgi:hypothetical protein
LKKFSILKILCKRVNEVTFLRFYITYILQILEFSNLSVVLTQTQSDRIESIQRKVTKLICYKLSKNHLLYEERLRYLKINSLKKRQIVQILKVLFKIRYKLFECNNKWTNDLVFYETSRNGVFCKLSKHKSICDKSFLLMPQIFLIHCIKISDLSLIMESLLIV